MPHSCYSIDSHLLVQINNLLENRIKLRQNFANNPYIATNSMAQNKADEDFLNKLTEIIKQNLDDENFNIDNLASEMNMSPLPPLLVCFHQRISVLVPVSCGRI